VETSNVGSEFLPGDHLQEMSKSVVIKAYGGGVMKEPVCARSVPSPAYQAASGQRAPIVVEMVEDAVV
jgi:hypothetical protein